MFCALLLSDPASVVCSIYSAQWTVYLDLDHNTLQYTTVHYSTPRYTTVHHGTLQRWALTGKLIHRSKTTGQRPVGGVEKSKVCFSRVCANTLFTANWRLVIF